MQIRMTKALTGLSSSMVLTALAVIVACVIGTVKLDAGRKLPSDFDQLDYQIADSQDLIKAFVSVPVLPALGESWKEATAGFKSYGLALVPDDGSMLNGSVSSYDGPINSWGGSVTGNPRQVLAVAKEIQKHLPVYLLDYSVDEGEMKLYLAVVGI